LPHADLGEGVPAAVVRAPPAGGGAPPPPPPLSERDVIAALRDTLAKFKQPKKVIFLDDLPRNTMGKVQKNVLRDQYAELFTKG
jgi:malonyl-CoA/methylmalonyl-CoA synthetase